MATTQHQPDDDRIYHKEVMSLAGCYSDMVLVAPRARDGFVSCVPFQPLRKRKGMLGRATAVLDVLRYVHKTKPDVCHFHEFEILPAVPFMKWICRTRWVYDVHEFYPETALAADFFPRPLNRVFAALVRLLEYWAARRCDFVFPAVEPLTARFNASGSRAITIFNYPKTEYFGIDSNDHRTVAQQYRDRRVILYQGTVSKSRGIFEALRAIRIIKNAFPDALLSVLGFMTESLRVELERFVTDAGLRGHVLLLPAVEHRKVYAYISLAKIGLVPILPIGQYPQALSNKQFEYWGCGVPVLASDLPAIASYVLESGGGRLYEARSPEALARTAIEMLQDEPGLRRMGELGRRAVMEKWNWKCMEERLVKAYGELDSILRPQNDSAKSNQ